jgi:hypothetical protein
MSDGLRWRLIATTTLATAVFACQPPPGGGPGGGAGQGQGGQPGAGGAAGTPTTGGAPGGGGRGGTPGTGGAPGTGGTPGTGGSPTAGTGGGAAGRDGGTPTGGTGGGAAGRDGGAPTGGTGGGAGGMGGAVPPPGPILPVFFLDLPGVSCDVMRPNTLGRNKVMGRMKVIVDHDGMHTNMAALKARPAHLDMPVGVSRRGESSVLLNFKQLSFSIETRDPAGMGAGVSVLGMPDDEDWSLVSCWNDKTCMRHPLAYALGRTMGDWHPRTRFAEVYCNDDYKGLYLFVESPRRGKDRVNLPKVNPDNTAGADALSGGYIFRREGGGKREEPARNYASTVTGPDGKRLVYVYHYPRETELTPAQKDYLHGYISAFENGMRADPIANWIDVKSWARYTLLNELANNIDAFWKSIYFAKDRDTGATRGKLRISPVWDFNIAWGNADYRDGWKPDVQVANTLRTWRGECLKTDAGQYRWLQPIPASCGTCDNVYQRAAGGPPEANCINAPYIPFYFDRILNDASFQREQRCEWQAARRTGFTIQTVDMLINDWKSQLRPNVARHFRRWPELRGAVWPNPCGADKRVAGLPAACGASNLSAEAFLDHEAMFLRAWVNARLTYLDGRFGGACN